MGASDGWHVQLRAAAFPDHRYNSTVHQGSAMPVTDARPAEGLGEMPALMRGLDGFLPLVEALRAGRSATIDGAWGSSASLAAGTLGLEAPATLLVVLAHPHDLRPWADELHGFCDLR